MIPTRSIVWPIILIALSLSACATPSPISVEPSASAKATPQVIKQGAIGIQFKTKPGVTGASIARITPHSPAEQAGMRVGDLILRVDDVKVVDVATTVREIRKRIPGDQIHILYLRDGKEAQTVVTIAELMQVYSTAAEAGDAESQVDLGNFYREGVGVEKNDAEAVKWFRKAAEQGDAQGQVSLGFSYANGLGVARDDAEAVKWYRKAAEQGYASGQYNLGVMYRDGLGVARDDAEAVKWFRKAAEQGHSKAQNNLGAIYFKGLGVAQDYAEAVKWYRKAAEQGNANAQKNLGSAFIKGISTAKDEAEEVRLYRMVVEQGEAFAQQYNLIWAYKIGRGIGTEGAGQSREALKQYVSALQSLPNPPDPGTDQRLRERIFKLVARLDPPPAIPEEAERHDAYAKTAWKDAKLNDREDMIKDAVKEWVETIRLAPWWPEPYFNVAFALEKQGNYNDALHYFRLYLLAAPDAPDAPEIKKKIFELEFKAGKR